MKEEFWRAIVACNEDYDGTFFYGVTTTKIFCRPSCRSKTPKRENVKIFYNSKEPLAEGFRPCKRCRPDLLQHVTTKEMLVNKAKQYLSEHYTETIPLERLGKELYASPFYLHKLFKAETGMSPHQFILHQRVEVAKKWMVETNLPLTNIALEVGFKSSAHFSAVFRKMVGCTPMEYRLRANPS